MRKYVTDPEWDHICPTKGCVGVLIGALKEHVSTATSADITIVTTIRDYYCVECGKDVRHMVSDRVQTRFSEEDPGSPSRFGT